VPAPDLQIEKTASGNFLPGGNSSFTLVVTNVGMLAALGPFTVNDPLEPGLTLVTVTSAVGWACTASTATNVSCINMQATLNPTDSLPPITFTVHVSAQFSGT